MAALFRRVLCMSSPQGYCLSRITKPVSATKISLAHYSNKGSSKVVDINDERGIGDYPILPWVSAQDKSPYGWWDIQDRRNREDPLHEQDDILNMWVYDSYQKNSDTPWSALGQLTVVFSMLGLFGYVTYLYDMPSRDPAAPKEYPYNNLYLSRGGDPSKPPTEEDLKAPVRKSYVSSDIMC